MGFFSSPEFKKIAAKSWGQNLKNPRKIRMINDPFRKIGGSHLPPPIDDHFIKGRRHFLSGLAIGDAGGLVGGQGGSKGVVGAPGFGPQPPALYGNDRRQGGDIKLANPNYFGIASLRQVRGHAYSRIYNKNSFQNVMRPLG